MSQENFQVCDRDLSPELLERYQKCDRLAIDTETMGLLPIRDRLCLVQLCDEQGFVCAIRIARGQTDAPNLKRLLESEQVLKIFHFARFDVAMLRHHLNITVNPIFCTKIASKLARTYTNRHGLKDLVNELEQIELDKTAQSSDWGNAANLSEQQLSYAANDVRYLINVQQKLVKMLEREERLELAHQCFNSLPVIVSLDLLQYQGVFEH
ncbi:ribonuclease D [Desertifilum sp. FACHB-1129]|uniref:Ribonuclease D n=2 Tax=Desertifilum tharense IPPAS B-1220 TaxID=1781255 RepID=A0A1E5QGX6_9CYAN|nr:MULTISPECIES: ribonuclease H-like domain-containing protein [Desertifilum]MDA0210344.1 ribonuclease H-like domain-containing protein [Cyanobacteria bacterium FC1]MBD2310291.1 ribonuclease D [Desertifilum sp. FACHB-1129]MBD2322667.1 ribonuclease D [Desertifilum sp. FACHB-866]MBD2333545.1 ribonuclease D [Desertifilum sp. FACHB-868]OEJ73563.1 ribonuclease D [Desertifilum tharense IPPAS B-1220]